MADPVENIIAKALRKRIDNDPTGLHRVVIDIDTSEVTLAKAYERVRDLIERARAEQSEKSGDRTEQHIFSSEADGRPYITARLQGKVIQGIVALDQERPPGPLISSVRRDLDDGRRFNPDNMIRTAISIPMLEKIEADEEAPQSVLIELNINFSGGRSEAKKQVRVLIMKATGIGDPEIDDPKAPQRISKWKTDTSEQYVYARLKGITICEIARLDQGMESEDGKSKPQNQRAIYHIWPDFTLRAQIWRSGATVKADACRRSFDTLGKGIVWAVFDSGIDPNHPHFEKHQNLVLPSGLTHMDFTGSSADPVPLEKLSDDYGHGTHVAGIIAGELGDEYRAVSLAREKDQTGKISCEGHVVADDNEVMGVAPECTLLSYKVLDKNGEGEVSTVIAAIQKVQELNGYGRNIIIHGVNMSLGYDFDPEWFACGQSPVCVEVDRLVRSGVAVVIAAGNTGKGFVLTINDPGNAELAVTVGATHRDMPHRYGVSYFSSKGPTGDGRLKPDLLAPGERIISCGAGPDLKTYRDKSGVDKPGALPDLKGKKPAFYLERSGTSMAAPHVSGVIAGILSARGEFVGLPEDIKDLLVKNATDLGRERSFQGGGLVDMMRTIQAM
jgi:serine protease AprX